MKSFNFYIFLLSIIFSVYSWPSDSNNASEPKLLSPESQEMQVIDPELHTTEKMKSEFLESLMNDVTNFRGLTEQRKSEIEEKYKLSPNNYSVENIDEASINWGRENLKRYPSINDLLEINLPLSSHGRQTIMYFDNLVDSYDLKLMLFFENLINEIEASQAELNEKLSSKSNRVSMKNNALSEATDLRLKDRTNSDYRESLKEYIKKEITTFDLYSREKTLKSMLNLIDRQKTVQKESYIFFKAILKIWETEEIHMDDSLLSILRSSLLVKSLDKLDKVFFEIQRVLVMSNRYTVLKNFERLYRLPSHPSNSVISIQNSSVGASSFYLELVAGWVASSFSVYQNDIRDTVNIYFKNKIDSLNTDTNLIESVLEEHLLEKDYKKALAKTVDMVETTRYSDISLDIKFLIDSLIRAESLGRNIELKLAILLLKDAEFMSLYGSKFIEFILLAHGYDIKNNSPITKLSNFANAKKILDTIKSKIKKEYSWSDYKGPWSITSVNKILGPFYTYRPNSIVKAIGHNLKARVLVNTAKRLLANKKARTNGKDRPSIGSDQSCKNSSRK